MPWKDPERQRAYMREYMRTYLRSEKGKSYLKSSKAYRHDWKKRNPRTKEARHAEYKKQVSTEEGRKKLYAAQKRRVLKKKYGLTPEEFQALFTQQNGVCAICREPPTRDNPLCVDHCHKTNRRRGLLCRNCNLALGNMKDNPARLRAGADYIEKHSLT